MSEDSAGADPAVRRYELADAEAVQRLHRRALSAAGTDPADVPGTADLRWIPETYLEPGGEFLVVELGGATDDRGESIVAMGGLVVDDARGELYRVAVDPARQRAGYGSLLIEELEAAARERGVERIASTTARRQVAAVAFYAARGYEETGRERHGEYELIGFEKRLDR